ncbi:MAG: hypothetical protein O3A38_09165, partial [Proteobacteria bacterium]|nr:hypothetical protein [Pseudomonadota bacterium]
MRLGLWCRSDESVGGGHLGRMLALAGAMRERGDEAVLLMPSATRAFAAERIAGHDIAICENPASPFGGPWDWVCFDDYAVGRAEETAWRGAAGRLLVVDDLADRPHDCDALVDPQPYRRAAHYDGLLPFSARRWIGPAYAPVSPTVAGRRAASLEVRKASALGRVVVSFGMARNRAPYDAALEALARAGLDLEVVCLVADPEIADALRHAHAGRIDGLSVRPAEPDPSALFAAADLVIGT